jgi:transcriptional regulator with XRE-family HTH domain
MPARSIVDPRFPSELRRRRVERGYSLRELARMIHQGKTYLHELETGAKVPTVDVAQRLDVALEAAGELASLVSADTGVRRRDVFAAAGLAVTLPRTAAGYGRQVGADVPAQIVERTARLRRLDDFLGGADTWRVFGAEVMATDALIKNGSYTETTGNALLAVLAEQAQLAGWAAFDAGLWAQSDELYRMSLEAARDAGDLALAANALVFQAYQALGAGDLATGVQAAVAAVETAGDGVTPGVRTLLHCRRAWAHAVAGQATEAETQLGAGAAAINEYHPRTEPDWVYWVDRDEVDIMTGRCWTVLRRPLRAIATLEQVLDRYDDTHARDKALYLSWLADAYLDANEIEQGCAVASRAIKLGSGVGSIRPYDRIGQVVDRAAENRELPCAADLVAEFKEWSRRRSIAAATPGMLPSP